MLHHRLEGYDVEGRLYLNSLRDKLITLASQTSRGVEIDIHLLGALGREINAKKIEVLYHRPVRRHSQRPRKRQYRHGQTGAGLGTARRAHRVRHRRSSPHSQDRRRRDHGRGQPRGERLAQRGAIGADVKPDEPGGGGQTRHRRGRPISLFPSGSGQDKPDATPNKAEWYQLQSVGIGNGREDDPEANPRLRRGATRYTPTDPLAEITPETLLAVQQAIAGKNYRENVQSPEWVGYAIAEELGLDPTTNKASLKISSAAG